MEVGGGPWGIVLPMMGGFFFGSGLVKLVRWLGVGWVVLGLEFEILFFFFFTCVLLVWPPFPDPDWNGVCELGLFFSAVSQHPFRFGSRGIRCAG